MLTPGAYGKMWSLQRRSQRLQIGIRAHCTLARQTCQLFFSLQADDTPGVWNPLELVLLPQVDHQPLH